MEIFLFLSLQASSQDYNLASHSTYVVCANFLHDCRDLKFKNRTIDFWETVHGNFITLRVFPEICWEECVI